MQCGIWNILWEKNERKRLYAGFKQCKKLNAANGKKSIVLIRPPFISPRSGPPVGLAYLQNILKQDGHNVLLIDINQDLKSFTGLEKYNRDFVVPENHPALSAINDRLTRYCGEVLALGPDIIGVTLSYPTYKYGLEMAKRLSKNVRCIAGGPMAGFNEKQLLALEFFDTVISGYGDEAVLEAVHKKGIIQKELDRTKEYRPDYTGIGIGKYNGCLPIVTSRGCPHKCNFCTQHHPYFRHSINSVVSQIRNTPGARSVIYNDSNINADAKRTEELFGQLSRLPKKPRGHIFGMEVKEGFDKYAPLMARSGIKEVRIGIESGSFKERKEMDKPDFGNDLVLKLIKELTSYKICVWAQFIFCYPSQTEDDRQKTLELMRDINRECDRRYVKHFWYKFVVHHGREEFFFKKYGVKASSPQNWGNSTYHIQKIRALSEMYSRLIPSNVKIFL